MKTTHVVISYVPLLRGEPAQLIEPESDALKRLLDTNAGHVQAVLWLRDESGTVQPVLVLDRAEEVREHLVEWAEGDPADWFYLGVDEAAGEYALGLYPRVERSVERYRTARGLATGWAVPDSDDFKAVFVPVLFHGPLSSVSTRALATLPDRVDVGLLDRSRLPDDPSLADPGDIRVLRGLEVTRVPIVGQLGSP